MLPSSRPAQAAPRPSFLHPAPVQRSTSSSSLQQYGRPALPAPLSKAKSSTFISPDVPPTMYNSRVTLTLRRSHSKLQQHEGSSSGTNGNGTSNATNGISSGTGSHLSSNGSNLSNGGNKTSPSSSDKGCDSRSSDKVDMRGKLARNGSLRETSDSAPVSYLYGEEKCRPTPPLAGAKPRLQHSVRGDRLATLTLTLTSETGSTNANICITTPELFTVQRILRGALRRASKCQCQGRAPGQSACHRRMYLITLHLTRRDLFGTQTFPNISWHLP